MCTCNTPMAKRSAGSSQRWSTPPVEVTNVSPHGFWLFIGEQEVFLSFTDFPWFKDASIQGLSRVELPSPHPLYWPDLDIDLAVDSLAHPEPFPWMDRSILRDRGGPAGRHTDGRHVSGSTRRSLSPQDCANGAGTVGSSNRLTDWRAPPVPSS